MNRTKVRIVNIVFIICSSAKEEKEYLSAGSEDVIQDFLLFAVLKIPYQGNFDLKMANLNQKRGSYSWNCPIISTS
jgi:hypothetical protein